MISRRAISSFALLVVAQLHAGPLLAQEAAGGTQDEDAVIALAVLDRLNAAWNAGDGQAFAEMFTADADVINIFGQAYKGSADLKVRMQAIFDSIFKGSRHVARHLEIARRLDESSILVVSSTRIIVPAGPMSPETRNRQTLILVREGDGWRIRHWHNTTIAGQ